MATIFAASGIIVVVSLAALVAGASRHPSWLAGAIVLFGCLALLAANVTGAATKARRCQSVNDELRADHAHSLSMGSGFPADAGNAKEHDALRAVDSRDENLMPLNES
jgi:hypothetical protein